MVSPQKLHAGCNHAQQVRLQRTQGTGRISFKPGMAVIGEPPTTRLDNLFQQGSARIKLPKSYSNVADAVLINTAGGLTGGDEFKWRINAGHQTQCVVTTQACEKIYRSICGPAIVSTKIEIGKGASVDWLPQETILFNRSALKRELHVEMAECASFLCMEAVIIGRAAMGEVVKSTDFHDRWRIRRNGVLVHGEDFRLNGDIAKTLANASVLGTNIAFASLVYIGPQDAEQLRNIMKNCLTERGLGSGFSIFNGKITARFSASDGYELRKILTAFLTALRGAKSLPKSWSL